MSKIEKVCSTCKHEPSDDHCLGCTFDYKNANGNTHWEPKEPFINKPCVSEGACHEDKRKVLEKIRAEIDADSTKYVKTLNWERARALEEALAIIDKYMAESEEV